MTARESLVSLVKRWRCKRQKHPVVHVDPVGQRSFEYRCACGSNLDVRTF